MGGLIRQSALLLMVLSLGLSTQGGLVVQALFHVRQDYIAKHLCENREKPHLKCHGKCFLKKHLHEAEQQQKQSTSTLSASPVFFYVPAETDATPSAPASERPFASHISGSEADGFASLTDPPPRAT